VFAENLVGGTCARVCPVELLCQGACVLHHERRRPVEVGRLQRYACDVALSAGTLWGTQTRPTSASSPICSEIAFAHPTGFSELDDLARLRRRTCRLSGRRPERVAVASRASARGGDRRAYAAVPAVESSGDPRASSPWPASTSASGAARALDVLTRRPPVGGARCRPHRARRRRGVLRGGGGTFDV
jgi:hypothetical protein